MVVFEVAKIVLLLILFVLGEASSFLFPIFGESQTFDGYVEAESYCRKRGRLLPELVTVQDYARLVAVAQSENVNEFWLPVKRRQFEKLTFLDNEEMEDVQVHNAGDCGMFDCNSPVLRTTECSSLWLGYICQINPSNCFPSKVLSKQILIDDACFEMHFEKVNWFEARYNCKKMGGDLAKLKNTTKIEMLRRVIREEHILFGLPYFWLGFRKSAYMVHMANGKSRESHAVFWDYGQPSNDHDCVFAKLMKDGRYYWMTGDCSGEKRTLCVTPQLDSQARRKTSASSRSTSIPTLHIAANAQQRAPLQVGGPRQGSTNGGTDTTDKRLFPVLVMLFHFCCAIWIWDDV